MMPNELFNQIDCRRRHTELGVIGVETLRCQPRIMRFVVRGISFEADTEGSNSTGKLTAHDAGHDRGVESSAKKRAQGHVADQTPRNRALDQFTNARLDFSPRG